MYSIYQLIIASLVGYVVGWLTMMFYYKITNSKKFGGYVYSKSEKQQEQFEGDGVNE